MSWISAMGWGCAIEGVEEKNSNAIVIIADLIF